MMYAYVSICLPALLASPLAERIFQLLIHTEHHLRPLLLCRIHHQHMDIDTHIQPCVCDGDGCHECTDACDGVCDGD